MMALMNIVSKYLPGDFAPPRRKGTAIALALSGILLPGLHKFYLGQRTWGIAYLLLLPTHVPQVASLIEAVWYGILNQDEFDYNFNRPSLYSFKPPSTTPSPSSPAITDPGYQFRSAEDVAIAAKAGVEIDVNRATENDWMRLPILTEQQGRSLATLTQAGVQFHCLDDLAAALSVPGDRLKPLEPILKFYYYDPVDLETPKPVNPNQASIADLAGIPSMSIALALQIIHHRTTQPFANLSDLQQRLSLDAATIEAIMHYLNFDT
jgi:DNA uptake protein ComE-like DNA-binding protein/TM2 domain-containing membrane protein YozV